MSAYRRDIAMSTTAFDCAGATHTGLVRPHNEDHFLVTRFGRFVSPVATNMSEPESIAFRQEGCGLIVADGMGGAAAGEFASELAVGTLHALALDTPDWIFATTPVLSDEVMERMAERFRRIDDMLKEYAARHEKLLGMGTTMTLAALLGPMLVLTHVGDSRAYLLRAGSLHRLTTDHTVAQEMIDAGMVESEDQVAGRLRHALTSVLGGIEGPAVIDVRRVVLKDGDRLLLCTDGLTNMVPNADIARFLQSAATADLACQCLIDAALAGGGRDNVSVAAAFCRFTSPGT
jgi:protein phosphatase